MSGLLLAPSGTVVAEDVRNLETHRGMVGSGGQRCLLGQALQRTGDLSERARCHLRIQRRGLQLLMPKQQLEHADVLFVLEQVGGKAAALMPGTALAP